MNQEEVDTILNDKGEAEYMKSKWLLYPICNALMVKSRHKQLVLTQSQLAPGVKEVKDSFFRRMFRGLFPFTASNSLHILLSAAF